MNEDNMGCDAYLECTGSRNERFYGNNGYELVRRLPIVTKEDSLKVENLEGLAAMKRAPKSTA